MTEQDQYRLGERLGGGGFADVFRATVAGQDSEVAVKRMHAGGDASRRACMMREALIVSASTATPRRRCGREGTGAACSPP